MRARIARRGSGSIVHGDAFFVTQKSTQDGVRVARQ